jgi:hypothetical protein
MNCGFTYEIRDKTNPDMVYYGSSELPTLEDRIKSHLTDFNIWKKTGKKYCSSFKVLEQNNYTPTLLKIVFFTTKWELWEHERKLIEYQVCVNKQIPNRSRAEWCEANPNYKADYYQDNKDKINKKFVCECGGNYTSANKSNHINTKIHQDWLKSSNTKNH